MKHFLKLILLIITSSLYCCSAPQQVNRPIQNIPVDINCLKIKAKIISTNDSITQLEIIEVIKYGRSAPILTKGTKIDVKTKLKLPLNKIKIFIVEKEHPRMGDHNKKPKFRLKKIIK